MVAPPAREWNYHAVETEVAKVFSYFFVVVAKTLLPCGSEMPWRHLLQL